MSPFGCCPTGIGIADADVVESAPVAECHSTGLVDAVDAQPSVPRRDERHRRRCGLAGLRRTGLHIHLTRVSEVLGLVALMKT
jgi:hypothetical protein